VTIRTGLTGWDARVFRSLNDVPSAIAPVLTLFSRLFSPIALAVVVAVAGVVVVVGNRSFAPAVVGAAAGGAAWVCANAAKVLVQRPRPLETIADALVRQQVPHGSSFPSSHTAVAIAIAIALIPFLARPVAAAGLAYAALVGWSRVYLGVHYPLDVIAGIGIGLAVGGATLLVLRATWTGGAQPQRAADAFG
jgi:undecaprenyl-diphosphatase